MAENTAIEWADDTFNPWEGCTKVGPGCDNCYAEARADRYGTVKWGAGQPRRLTSDANWKKPLQWNKKAEASGTRRRVFCSSLADVFDNEVPQEWRDRLFELIRLTPHLDWLLLTKRIGNANSMLPSKWLAKPMPNLWLGATVVNQQEANRDIPKLLNTPAVIRFLSMEPLLGPVDLLADNLAYFDCPRCDEGGGMMDPETGAYECGLCDSTGKSEDIGIDWVIVGGESGPRARPMHPQWARDLRDQCAAAGVAFLFKQWGEWAPDEVIDDVLGVDGWRKQAEDKDRYKLLDDKGTIVGRIGKKLAGRTLDGRTHDEVPKP